MGISKEKRNSWPKLNSVFGAFKLNKILGELACISHPESWVIILFGMKINLPPKSIVTFVVISCSSNKTLILLQLFGKSNFAE